MSKFVKRNTVVQMEINGEFYGADLGSDEAAIAIGSTVNRIAELQKSGGDTKSVFEEMKQAYKEGIDEILGNGASEHIFKDDERLSYHDDVFMYLANEIQRLNNEKLTQYSPERVQRKGK